MTIKIDYNSYSRCEGTHISVWAHLMQGKNDDDLEFPFLGKVTFQLLNQPEDKHHHESSYIYNGCEKGSWRVIDRDRANFAQGIWRFIHHNALGYNAHKNCQYLKGDCLIFRIYVEVPSCKHWLQCNVQQEFVINPARIIKCGKCSFTLYLTYKMRNSI